MTVTIQREQVTPTYVVQWRAEDGYMRERPFSSYRAAERYAQQVECRLLIEAMLASRTATKH